jgi:acyl-CoA thioester hydrolase
MSTIEELEMAEIKPVTKMAVRWRDLDPLGHVNHEVFLTYLEHTRDSWLDTVSDARLGPANYVVARIEVDYMAEIRLEAGHVTGRCRLREMGNTSFKTDELLTLPDGTVAARAMAVLVMWDAGSKTSRALTDQEREALAA